MIIVQYSVALRCFMAKTCISLFFPVLASKSQSLLIKAYTANTNRIQREFDSNGAIATFDHEPSAPKNKLSQTEACCHFAPPKRGGVC
jgi:hypothetical protein